MRPYRVHPDPPMTLADRVRQLNDNLQALAVRLKDAIAGAVSNAAAQAIRDVLRHLLGVPDDQPPRDEWPDDPGREADGWDHYDGDSWPEDRRYQRRPSPFAERPAQRPNDRWKDALRAAAQAGLWWVRQRHRERPLLTTALIVLVAGGTAFFAGPSLGACVSVVASIASLLLTADNGRSAASLLRVAE